MDTISALGQGDSPANARHEGEIIEHYNKLLSSEASSVQDKHLSVYLNEKGVGCYQRVQQRQHEQLRALAH
jgi:hypothetical protein